MVKPTSTPVRDPSCPIELNDAPALPEPSVIFVRPRSEAQQGVDYDARAVHRELFNGTAPEPTLIPTKEAEGFPGNFRTAQARRNATGTRRCATVLVSAGLTEEHSIVCRGAAPTGRARSHAR